MKPLKSVIFLLALFLIAVRASAQVPVPPPGSPISQTEIQLLQWAITQGGLVAVVLVVVWSYRRDFHRIFQSENERTRELLVALEGSTTALSAHAEVMRQRADADRDFSKAFLELSASVRACEAVREVFTKSHAK